MIRENKLYDELKVGDSASIKRVCTANDLYIFANASVNLNPLHLPANAATVRRKRSHPPCGSARWPRRCSAISCQAPGRRTDRRASSSSTGITETRSALMPSEGIEKGIGK